MAFSLVEVVLALGIFSFCILAIMGLFSVGLDSTKASEEEIKAANLASSLLCRIRSAPNANLTALDFPFPPVMGNVSGTVFDYGVESPIYIRADGSQATSAMDAQAGNGYAVAAAAYQDLSGRTTRFNLTLWWPATAAFVKARGSYTVNTFIDTETR